MAEKEMLSGNTWKFAVRVIFYIGLIRYDKKQKHPDACAGVMMLLSNLIQLE
ncbi:MULTISPECIES: hypothetical protein [Paenibacillus]|uniref:hypothetical protein n=1 Tax=Paenibacillus TaxID=44249 RepID=UPI0015C45C39|nr:MULTISPECIES: hypothetical protein [Paenibacillus]WDQ34516.1 hypothetical protein PTQ21_09860 [Paenibacillus marchantiae]